jgi:hypothetical protein
MKHKLTFTAALIALGIISSASAATTNEIHVTGSTAFRGNFFTAATAASGGIFDAPGGLALNGATSGSSLVTYVGKIGGVDYAFECSWTGSEAGIANVDGVATLANPGLPNGGSGAANLPGATTTFPKIDGTSGGFVGAGDLTLADTSQAVSLTKPPAHPALHDYGVVGVVTFVWEKGKNTTGSPTSTDAGDAAWGRLVNVTQPQMVFALGSTLNANFFTGNAADNTIPVAIVGRNAGSGTRVNTLLDTGFGVANSVSQFALNSTYVNGVLTYKVVPNNQGATYPSVVTSLGNSTDYTTTPNFVAVGDDGYESGGGVSQCLSCDLSASEVITLGYVGLSDAKAARDGKGASGTTPAQPGGAVILTLDGLTYSDAVVVNGTYSFWGHEHLYGSAGHTTITDNAANAIKAGIATAGGLGTGSATAQSSGIAFGSMLADKSGDAGYPAPL